MIRSLAERVEQNPEAAEAAFSRLDDALNLTLPGSPTHERYRDIESVGLAIVIARATVQPASYSPFDPTTLERLSFQADNQDKHPESWTPKEVDEEILGGTPPEGMGRFTAFALAKVNTISAGFANSSLGTEQVSYAPGKIGLAGARRIERSLVGVSGLWEVHDHVVGPYYAREFAREEANATAGRRASTLAGDLSDAFRIVEHVRVLNDLGEPAQMSRRALSLLISKSDEQVTRLLQRRAAYI